jgi:hypothetical protein
MVCRRTQSLAGTISSDRPTFGDRLELGDEKARDTLPIQYARAVRKR